MRNPQKLMSILTVWAAAVACDSAAVPVVTTSSALEAAIHCDATSGLCFRVDARGPTCGASTWVAPAVEGTCPEGIDGDRGRWAEVRDGASEASAAFCRFRWSSPTDAAPEAEPLARLRATRGLDELAPDCEVVAPFGDALDLTWSELQRAFFEQTERLDPLPAGGAAPAPVRVEIVDSAVTRRAPDGEPSRGRNEHGRAMGLIVRRLACPSPGASCRAEVASSLALPLITTPAGVVRDPVRGGYFGSFMDLAAAIDDATTAWRRHAPGHRLVINLSLGWEPDHGGAYTSSPRELSAPVRAVWESIARARCAGAAVVAAVGNRPEGPDAPRGAMFPAAWAEKPAPSPSTCRALGVASPAGSSLGTEPLVFAASGLEPNDEDLGLAREGARAELAAPASHAVVRDGSQPSALQTGSSVAAAVVSAAAAVVWSYRPGLSPAEVMETVYDGGVDLGRRADVCPGTSSCGQTHRVSICGALEAACRAGGGGCPASLASCSKRPAGQAAPASVVSLAPLGLPPPVSARSLTPLAPVGWPCSGELNATHLSAVTHPCPASQLPSRPAIAVVSAQSDHPICPHCAYSPALMKLYIEIDSTFVGVLTNPVFRVVVDASIGDIRYFDLSAQVPILNPGDQTMVEDLDIGAPSFESATLEFLVDGTHSERSPVLHWD